MYAFHQAGITVECLLRAPGICGLTLPVPSRSSLLGMAMILVNYVYNL